jgi:tetratricopeptide (TPR) repeat protein
VADRLRPLWDFDDPDASEQRFRGQLERETADAGRAEVLTQLARVAGLRGDFEAARRLLGEAEAVAGADAVVHVRVLLERGRVHRSSGDVAGSLPLFEEAFARALDAGEHYLAGDAAHMAAIAAPDRRAMEQWTRRGLEVGEREPDAAYWAGPLLNNLAWAYYDAGEYGRALELFESALEARERDPENEAAIAWARYGVAQALRALGRADEAVAAIEPAVEWSRRAGKPEPDLHDELAACYQAVGRAEEARRQAGLAVRMRDA